MILVAGEALFDLFVSADDGSGFAFDARPGGSPFNVAIGLARLGQSTAFLGGLSVDFLGGRLMRLLAAEGVGTNFIQHRRQPTTLSVVGLNSEGAAAYAFTGDGADRVVLADDIPALPADCRAIHLGSFSAVLEPIGSSLDSLLRRESGRRLIAYDPNIRITIEPDIEVWRRKLESLLPLVHLLKISLEDFNLLFPGADPSQMARRWLGRGPRLVVLTRGSEGAWGWTATAEVEMAAVPTELVDTVGAGDSYQAALLAGLAETWRLNPTALSALTPANLAQLLAFAGTAAAITCSRRGADLPRRNELPPLSTSH
ncbi:MAG TPA: carbohydrate kinase [Dongiaceae bacterium]